MYTISNLYDLEHTLAKDYLSKFTYPWEALSGIKDFILELGKTLDPNEYEQRAYGYTRAQRFSQPHILARHALSDRTPRFVTVRSFAVRRLWALTALLETALS